MAKKRRKKISLKMQVLGIVVFLAGAIFMPTTFILLVGMLPTPFAILADKTRGKHKVLTVGAMNLTGCVPFVFELWLSGHNFEKSFEIVTNVQALIVMWSAAALGYMINWALTGFVSSLLYQKGVARVKAIHKRQEDLVDRWGNEVTGEMELNELGFALEASPAKSTKSNTSRRAK